MTDGMPLSRMQSISMGAGPFFEATGGLPFLTGVGCRSSGSGSGLRAGITGSLVFTGGGLGYGRLGSIYSLKVNDPSEFSCVPTRGEGCTLTLI